jgi:NAD(P)-dependent dehydrogenase (short-subunit alcohol dehydrogenase family)
MDTASNARYIKILMSLTVSNSRHYKRLFPPNPQQIALVNIKMSRVCLITGGTQGIGQETAELLASEGWKVVISGRNRENGQEVNTIIVASILSMLTHEPQVVTKIQAAGGEAKFVQADVSTQASVKKLHEETVAAFGQLERRSSKTCSPPTSLAYSGACKSRSASCTPRSLTTSSTLPPLLACTASSTSVHTVRRSMRFVSNPGI